MSKERALSVRILLLSMAIAAAAYVLAMAAYSITKLHETAADLRASAATMAEQYEALHERRAAFDQIFDDVERNAAVLSSSSIDQRAVDSLTHIVQGLAESSVAVNSNLALVGIPNAMRSALARTSAIESSVAGELLEVLEALRFVDIPTARRWLASAEHSTHILDRAINEVQQLGLRDVVGRQRSMEAAARGIVNAVRLWAIAGVLLGALAMWLMQRRLFRPLADLNRGLADVAAGRLGTSLRVSRNDELGRLKAHFNAMTDVLRTRPEIEALRASEAQLHASRQNFQTIFELAPVGISLSELETGKFVDVNPAFTQIVGYTRDELVGRTSLELGLWPDPEQRAEMSRAMGRQISTQDVELQLVSKSGRPVQLLGSARVTEIGGKQLLISTFSDLSELRRAEHELREGAERLRAVFNSGVEAHVIVRIADGAILDANRAFEQMYGFSPDEYSGRKSIDLGIWADPAVRLELLKEFETTGHVENYPIQARRKNGEVFPVSYSIHRLDAAREGLYLGVITDLSEQQRSAEQLRQLEEQFRQAQRLEAVGRLAGGVAHDFNNVLTAITGIGAMLRDELGPNDPVLPDVEEIMRAADRAAVLTRQLLAFSRRQVLQPRVLNLNDVIQNLSKMLQRLLGEDIILEQELAGDLPPVKVDAGQMEQVIVNLAVNARDAMATGGRLIIGTHSVTLDEAYVRDHTDAQPGPHVCITVSDTGSGMSTATLAHIFEPFFTTKEEGTGTGLGLSTVHGIVAQSGGSIWVDSEVGKGTTFSIYFPEAERVVEEEAAQPASAVSLASHGETILLTEDDPSVRVIVTRALSKHGYKLLIAQSAEDALSLAATTNQRISLLVSDLLMPGMTGQELALKLLETHASLPVLFISGYTKDEAVVESSLPHVDFLQKPFTPAELATKVRAVLDRQPTV